MKVVRVRNGGAPQSVLRKAGELLRHGGVVVHPTETVYGLAACYDNSAALERCIRMKGRSPHQPFSILVNSIHQIIAISGEQSPWVISALKNLLPDALTVLIPRHRKLQPDFWNQFPLLGFRYPRHLLSTGLVESSGNALITTSANLSSDPPAKSVRFIPDNLLDSADLVIDGGQTEQKIPSTIIQLHPEEKKITLVREGAVSWKIIQNHFVP